MPSGDSQSNWEQGQAETERALIARPVSMTLVALVHLPGPRNVAASLRDVATAISVTRSVQFL